MEFLVVEDCAFCKDKIIVSHKYKKYFTKFVSVKTPLLYYCSEACYEGIKGRMPCGCELKVMVKAPGAGKRDENPWVCIVHWEVFWQSKLIGWSEKV